MLELKEGNKVKWAGFDDTQETDRGPIRYCSFTMGDGWTVYESVAKNEQGAADFYVLVTLENTIVKVIEVGEDEDVDHAIDAVDEAKKRCRSKILS